MLPVLSGSRVKYRSLGIVADLCAICREFTAFQVHRIGLAGHLYFISVGDGELVGFQRTCQRCGVAQKANPLDYQSFSPTLDIVPRLLANTFPNASQLRKSRIELEARIKADPTRVTAAERLELVREPFIILNHLVETRFAKSEPDKETSLGIAGSLLLFLLMVYVSRLDTHWSKLLAGVCMVATALSLLGTIWFGLTSRGRFLDRKILPGIVRSLRPLRPPDAELEAALMSLKAMKLAIGKRLKPKRVRLALDRHGSSDRTALAASESRSN